MTKVYVMSTCPDCFEVKARLSDNPDFEIIDIGEHVRSIGIPCFVAEDGRISFDTEEFIPNGYSSGASCSLDGKGC